MLIGKKNIFEGISVITDVISGYIMKKLRLRENLVLLAAPFRILR